MEAIVNGVTCIKGEISSIMTLMRLNTRWSDQTGRRVDAYQDEGPLVLAFRRLNVYLEGLFDLREVDCVMYISPFHQVIVSDSASGPLTKAALSSLSKFALYGFLQPNLPRAQEGVSLIAKCISNCIFEETDWESDEVIFMKLLELSALTMRCEASCLLSVGAAWDIYSTCLNIHAQSRASKILRSEAETALRDLTLTAFSRAVPRKLRSTLILPGFGSEHNIVQRKGSAIETSFGTTQEITYTAEDFFDAMRADSDELLDHEMWRQASASLFFSNEQGVTALLCKIMNTLSCKMDLTAKNQTVEGVKFALSLMNVALEAGGPSLGPLSSLVDIMRADVCRHLLRASQSDDLAVLSLALRVIFNIFVSIKDHMKIQLEVFLTSVHLRLLRQSARMPLTAKGDGAESMIALNMAREELALESLLEFCREPSLMVDLYTNYDCDVTCTNLFHSIIESLCTRAFMPTDFGANTAGGKTEPTRLHILNRLALDGVFAVLHAVAVRVIHSDSSISEDAASSKGRSGSSSPRNAEAATSQFALAIPPQNLRSESGDSLVSVPLHHVNSFDGEETVDRWCAESASTPDEGDQSFLDQSSIIEQCLDITSQGGNAGKNVEDELQMRARDADVLRQRKLKKQLFHLIASKFNERPLKDEWLKLALAKGVIEPASEESIRVAKEADESMRLAAAAAVEKGGKVPPLVDKSDRALSNLVDAQSVAQFLKNTYGLGKTQVGEFIGKGPMEMFPFFHAVRTEYVNTFSFPPDFGFAQCLRVFLGHFRMPGEAQCIDRLLEAFAARLFVILGIGKPFLTADAVFILSFSTIMLNTDLHNPRHNKGHKKMTLDEFLRNNRDINDGKALPREYLTSLYNDIAERQIQVDVNIQDNSETDINGISDATSWKALLNKSAADQAPAVFTSTWDARLYNSANSRPKSFFPPSIQDRDMFLVMAEPVLEAIQSVWNDARGMDDALMGKLVSGIADFASICVSLGLRQFLTLLVEALSNTTQALLERPAHLSYLMRLSESEDGGARMDRQLTYLLGPGFDIMLRRQNIARMGEVDEESVKPWEGAHFVRGELAIRVLFYIVETHVEALDRQAWSAVLHLLLWIRQRGSLSPILALLQADDEFWEGADRNINEEHDISLSKTCEEITSSSSSAEDSLYARACHRKARSIRQSDTHGSKGLLSTFTGILFGSVTLTEQSDGVILSRVQTSDGNSCPKNRMDSHALLRRMTLVKQTLVYSRAGVLMLHPVLGNQSLAAARSRVTLLDSILDILEDRLDAIMFIAHKAAAADAVNSGSVGGPIKATGLNHIHDSEVDFGYAQFADTGGPDGPRQSGQIPGTRGSDQSQELEVTLLLEWAAGIVLGQLGIRYDTEENADTSSLKLSEDAKPPMMSAASPKPSVQLTAYEITQVFAHWSRLRGLISRLFENGLFNKHPYLVERAIGFVMRAAMILIPAHLSSPNVSQSLDESGIWECLRYIGALPRAYVSNIARSIGAAARRLISSSLRASSTPDVLTTFITTADQWHILLSLLSAATAGPDGRGAAWDGLCLILDHRPLTPVSFAPCRVLLLRFMYSAFSDGEGDDIDKTAAGSNSFTQPAMDRIMGLSAMVLGGALWTRRKESTMKLNECLAAENVSRSESCADVSCAPELFSCAFGPMVSFSLPKVGEHNHPIASPVQSPLSSVTSINSPTRELNFAKLPSANRRSALPAPHTPSREDLAARSPAGDFQTPTYVGLNDNFANHYVYSVLPGHTSFKLTVPAVSLPIAETEQIWLDSVRRLAETAGSATALTGLAAVYNLQAVLSFGRAVNFSVDTWISVLQSLVARMPLLLSQNLPQSTRYDPTSGQLTELSASDHCLLACNTVFELLVAHAVDLRISQAVTQPWLRFCRALAENVNFAHTRGQSMSRTFDEMLEMVAALLRLLRTPVLPQISPEPREKSQTTSKSGGLFGWLLGGIDDSSAPETEVESIDRAEPAQLVSSDEENDGPLLFASWNVLCQYCPTLHVALGRKNSQLVEELTALSKYEKMRKATAPAVRVPSAISAPRAPQQNPDIVHIQAEAAANLLLPPSAAISLPNDISAPISIPELQESHTDVLLLAQCQSNEHPGAALSVFVENELLTPQPIPQSQTTVVTIQAVQHDATNTAHHTKSSNTPMQHRRMPIGSIGVAQVPAAVPLDVPKPVPTILNTPGSKPGDTQPEQVPEMPDLLNGRGKPSLNPTGANLGLGSPVPLARFLVAPLATSASLEIEIDPMKPLLV